MRFMTFFICDAVIKPLFRNATVQSMKYRILMPLKGFYKIVYDGFFL